MKIISQLVFNYYIVTNIVLLHSRNTPCINMDWRLPIELPKVQATEMRKTPLHIGVHYLANLLQLHLYFYKST